jgi:hypothetical protein
MDRRSQGALVAVLRAIEDNHRALAELRSTVHNISRALEAARQNPRAQPSQRVSLVAQEHDHSPEPRGEIRTPAPHVPNFSERPPGPSLSGWESVSAFGTNTDRDYDYFAELDERLAGMNAQGSGTRDDARRSGGGAHHLRRA